jgi:hypothetical protein
MKKTVNALPVRANPDANLRPSRQTSIRSIPMLVIPVQSRPLPPRAPERKPVAMRPVRFQFDAPGAQHVCVAGSFNNWSSTAHPLIQEASGSWTRVLDLPPGRHEYRFVVDGRWCDDPRTTELVPNPYGGFNAVAVV